MNTVQNDREQKVGIVSKPIGIRIIVYLLLFVFLSFVAMQAFALDVPLSLFPIQNYHQNVDTWLNPADPNYTKPLMSVDYQKKRLRQYYNRYFSSDENSSSPWSKHFINRVLSKADKLYTNEKKVLEHYGNQGKDLDSTSLGFGENYRPYDKAWIDKIAANIDFESLKKATDFRLDRRAILVQNTLARALPSADPHFYNFKLPGQGYPFDNLQVSAMWAGTPLYIISESKDKSWSLVLGPEFKAWIQTKDLARVSDRFVKSWQLASHQKLAAITETETPIHDNLTKEFQFTAYVGSIFPLVAEENSTLKILIPVKNSNGYGEIRNAIIKREQGALMPLAATPQNFAKLFKTLQKRPYAWGGGYFYNDCSQELKSLYAPFGIWLPRNSKQQATAGKKIDKSDSSVHERLQSLQKEGHPLTSIIYINGHIMLYLGKFKNMDLARWQGLKEDNILMTYQNIWALKPKDASRRAVIGEAVFLPLLETFPEDKEVSLLNTSAFQIIHLDEWPEQETSAEMMYD